ncbi:MAG: DoxX family protein [Sphingomonadales bacterium]|nr:DoxX family protein [Sphingomonadales bacterium]
MLRKIERKLDRGERYTSTIDPIFRLLTSLIFIIGGLGHFGRADDMLLRVEESPWRAYILAIGDPLWLLRLSGAVFVAAGVTLTLGWMTRLSALALFVTLIPITITIHFAPDHVGPLFKNVAIMGALLFLFVRGPGAYASDNTAS